MEFHGRSENGDKNREGSDVAEECGIFQEEQTARPKETCGSPSPLACPF